MKMSADTRRALREYAATQDKALEARLQKRHVRDAAEALEKRNAELVEELVAERKLRRRDRAVLLAAGVLGALGSGFGGWLLS